MVVHAWCRIYHAGRIVASRLEHSPAITQARGRLRVNPPDNDSEVKCEVVSPGSTKPKVTSTRLSVLCKCPPARNRRKKRHIVLSFSNTIIEFINFL